MEQLLVSEVQERSKAPTDVFNEELEAYYNCNNVEF